MWLVKISTFSSRLRMGNISNISLKMGLRLNNSCLPGLASATARAFGDQHQLLPSAQPDQDLRSNSRSPCIGLTWHRLKRVIRNRHWSLVDCKLIAASSGVLLIFRQRLSVSCHSRPVSLSTAMSLQPFSRSHSAEASADGEVPQESPARGSHVTHSPTPRISLLHPGGAVGPFPHLAGVSPSSPLVNVPR